jgi:hypothetical protein
MSNPSISKDEPVRAGNAQDKRSGCESTTLRHPINNPEQTLNSAEQLPKGKTNGLKVDSEGSKGEIDDKAERNKISAELKENRIVAERQLLVARAELSRLDSLGGEITLVEQVRRMALFVFIHHYESDLRPRLDRFLSEDE